MDWTDWATDQAYVPLGESRAEWIMGEHVPAYIPLDEFQSYEPPRTLGWTMREDEYRRRLEVERHRAENERQLMEQNSLLRIELKELREKANTLREKASTLQEKADPTSYATLRRQYDAGKLTIDQFDELLTPEAAEEATLADPFTESSMGFLEPRKSLSDARGAISSVVVFLVGALTMFFGLFSNRPVLMVVGCALFACPALWERLNDESPA